MVKSSQYISIIPHRVIQLTTASFWVPETKAAPPTSQLINKFPPKRVKNLATPSSIFICILLKKIHVERSVLDPRNIASS